MTDKLTDRGVLEPLFANGWALQDDRDAISKRYQFRNFIDAFGWMTRQAKSLADSLCQGRLVSLLEGGYNLNALADSVEAHVGELVA